ncbi:GNAT family N-acetyltransferase [Bacillus sp. 2205SS5-2]|uniref:GNAT family N-acetyltransferase n=1 Tax=Bacillus sp. 2205SS5-2 TaxID=3109031 RepID=UPI0030068990
MEIAIKPLKNENIDKIPSLISMGLEPFIFNRTIYSCHGYDEYIKKQLNEESEEVRWFGVYHRTKGLIGCSEWRLLDDSLLLNNLFVHPEFRGLQIGTKLLFEQGVDLAVFHKKKRIILDVFDHNSVAKGWYQSIGFRVIKSKFWYQIPFPDVGGSGEKTILMLNEEEAKRTHQKFGFSMLKWKTENGIASIGRIKHTLYRIVTPMGLEDLSLLYEMKRYDDNRQILLITEQTQPYDILCTNDRMEISVEELRESEERMLAKRGSIHEKLSNV